MACLLCPGPRRSDGTPVADPLYTGPAGHFIRLSPTVTMRAEAVCLECWLWHWWEQGQRGDATDYLFSLLLAGLRQPEIAAKLGISERTLRRRLAALRRNPDKVRILLADFGPVRACTL